MTRAAILYLASFAAHGAMAIGIVSLKGARNYEDIAIAMVESKKEPEKKPVDEPPPPPPPPPPKEESVKAKAAPAPKVDAPEPPPPAADAPAAASDAVPDFGLSLSGGGGSSSGSLAVPAAAKGTPSASATASADRVSKKVLAAPAAANKEEECAESPKKPKVISITQPAYTTEAREAQIAGKVRVEVTVDVSGKVVSARVLEGLGHGLDDAALAAAKGASFEAGTKCGKPTTATFVIAIRFAL
jgi:periplasmic protein TonB